MFSADFGTLSINNADFCYHDQSISTYLCFTQDSLLWAGHGSFDSASHQLAANGKLKFQQTRINNQLENRYLLDLETLAINDIDVQSLDAINIGKLTLNKLNTLQYAKANDKSTFASKQIVINKISLVKQNTLDIGNIKIDTPKAFLKKDEQAMWLHNRLLPGTGEKDKAGKTAKADATNNNKTTSFTTTLGDISIIEPDFCFQDVNEKLDYCLTQKQSSWKGKITVNPVKDVLRISGKLNISATRINNPAIHSDLLRLQDISVDGIQISSADNIIVGKVALKQLLAMQREATPASYSMWFDSLLVDNIRLKHQDLLKINRINLKQPGLQLSKNKDGKWEHDKWLPISMIEKTRPDSTSAKQVEENNNNKKGKSETKTDNTDNKPDAKPFNVVLNSLNINSRQKINFQDNSLTPVMHIGLKSLDINVKHVDSTRPKDKTTFNLKAKSDRHATIDLAGEALPFAAKPSFDAKGELRGFDLRAASPAAQKAIGHIIKSGQMDAELTLLAVDGVLDSNISLTLHQFNLEAKSKQDAEELDKTFGMPVNQSLSLLRDKDDSIHLDIPVTGDINNPEFDPTHAIIKATTKATTVALITFYTPYGLIYAGGNVLFDLATAMDFPPLLFTPGSSTLNEDNKKQLDKLSSMMTEKPQLHLTFCGIANMQDRLALFPTAEASTKVSKDNSGNKPKTPLAKLSKEQRSKLETLANERGEHTKEYLTDKDKIDHSRLILCTPVYSEEDDAISGVEINL